jgi:hypothetical protein
MAARPEAIEQAAQLEGQAVGPARRTRSVGKALLRELAAAAEKLGALRAGRGGKPSMKGAREEEQPPGPTRCKDLQELLGSEHGTTSL